MPVKDAVARNWATPSMILLDVRIACPVSANNVWQVNLRSADIVDPLLTEDEADKYDKDDTPYARLGFGFFATAISSLCVLWLHYLALLANLKVSRLRTFREQYQHTDLPASHAASLQTQYLSLCSSLFAHVRVATVKAIFMCSCGWDHPSCPPSPSFISILSFYSLLLFFSGL